MPELIDRHSRKIDYMRVSVTDRCNLRCRYCRQEGNVKHLPRNEILSYEEILRIVTIATRCGVKKIRITGGEPLTRKGIIHFIEQMNRNPAIEDPALTTNGILLGMYANELVKAGVKRVNISLDTLKPEKFHYITRTDLLSQVFNGIKAADEAGLSPIKINCVALRNFNDEEIIDFVRLAIEHPYHVRFIEFMPFGKDDYWSPNKIIQISEIMDIIKKNYSLVPITPEIAHNNLSMRFRIPGGAGEIGFISPISNHFCKTCNRIRLTPDGKLRNCLFSDQEVNIKRWLRCGADDKKLEEIIRGSIRKKPPGHRLQEDPSYRCKRSMWKIGG